MPAPRRVLRLGVQAAVRAVRVPLRRWKAPVALRFHFGIVAAVALLGAVSVGACGAVQQAETVTVTTALQTATTPKKPLRPDEDSGSGRTTPHPAKTVLTACDTNIRAKAATTTCGFAEDVFYEYWRWLEYSEVSDIKAFSPALRTFLPVSCNQREAVLCRTSAGALVRFPLSAIKAYTLENAAQYARNHTVSKGPDATSETPTPPTQGDSGCDPSYEGACLDPSSSDYDCEGGSGDGPDYTGTVTVVGDDHFGLDRDGDGVGCDS